MQLLLYSNVMVMHVIDGLDDDCEEVLIMEKATATGKPQQPSKPTNKTKKVHTEETESRNYCIVVGGNLRWVG